MISRKVGGRGQEAEGRGQKAEGRREWGIGNGEWGMGIRALHSLSWSAALGGREWGMGIRALHSLSRSAVVSWVGRGESRHNGSGVGFPLVLQPNLRLLPLPLLLPPLPYFRRSPCLLCFLCSPCPDSFAVEE